MLVVFQLFKVLLNLSTKVKLIHLLYYYFILLVGQLFPDKKKYHDVEEVILIVIGNLIYILHFHIEYFS